MFVTRFKGFLLKWTVSQWMVTITLAPLMMTTMTNGQTDVGDIDLGCPQGTYRHEDYCYMVSSIFVTYEDAEILCETGGGLLAPVKSIQTEEFLQKLRIRKFLHRYWFGLNDKKTEGEWTFSDNTRLSGFSKWQRNEPNNLNKQQHCVYMWLERHLEWDDEDCGRKFLFVCEYDEANCTRDLPRYGRSCYELSEDIATYDEADLECHNRGGFLANIKTEGTFSFIKTIIYADRFWMTMTDRQMQFALREQSNKASWILDTWIGVYFAKGEWLYSDETGVNFTNWAPGEPYNVRNFEDCVKLGQMWHDVQCDLRHGFICRYPMNNTLKESSSSIQNVNCIPLEQQVEPRDLESRSASSVMRNLNRDEFRSGLRLGVAQLSFLLTGSAILGMLTITLLFLTISWHKRRTHQPGTERMREEQDLEVLREPEHEYEA